MAIATERSETEVMEIIVEFREHEELCRRNEVQQRLRLWMPHHTGLAAG